MKILMEAKEIDFSKIVEGSLIVLDDTIWVVFFNGDSDEYSVASFKSDEILRSFLDIVDLRNYLKGFKNQIQEILPKGEFTLKVTRG